MGHLSLAMLVCGAGSVKEVITSAHLPEIGRLAFTQPWQIDLRNQRRSISREITSGNKDEIV